MGIKFILAPKPM